MGKDFSKVLLSDRKNDDRESKEISVYPELQAFIPPLTSEELEGLEKSIKEEGCREPLLLWENGDELVLVDGHNRYNICQKHGLSYKRRFKEFEDIDAVKNWMIVNQLSRRNLTELQKSYLRGLQYGREKKGLGGDRKSEKSGIQNEYLKTVDKLAEEHKVSKATIQRDEKFQIGLDKLTEGNKELKDKILSKEVKIPQSVVQEASDWDKKQIKEAVKKLEESGEWKPTKEVKETKKEPKNPTSEIIKEINKKLKGYTYERLVKLNEDLE